MRINLYDGYNLNFHAAWLVHRAHCYGAASQPAIANRLRMCARRLVEAGR